MPGDVRCSPCAGNGRVFAAVFPHPRSPAGKTGKQGGPAPMHAMRSRPGSGRMPAAYRTSGVRLFRTAVQGPRLMPRRLFRPDVIFPGGGMPGQKKSAALSGRARQEARAFAVPDGKQWHGAMLLQGARNGGPAGRGGKKEKTAVAEKGETGEGGKAPSRPGGAGLIWKEETDRAGRTMRVSSVERFRLFLRNRRGLVENAVYSTARGRAFHPSRGFGRF